MWFDLLIIFLLILLNAFFVAAETALLATRKSRLNALSQKKYLFRKFIRKTIANLNIYITTTQLGSTLVSIAIGWRSQSLVDKLINIYFGSYLVSYPFFSNEFFTRVVPFLVITGVLMIVGELAPKKLAMRNPERITLFLALPVMMVSNAFMPIVKLINRATDYILELIGRPPTGNRHIPYSENELKIILSQSIRDGIIPEDFKSVIYNAMRIKKIKPGQIMIKRSKVAAFASDEKIGEITRHIKTKNLRFNRYPVYLKKSKSFIGFIEAVDLLYALHKYGPGTVLSKTDTIRRVIKVNAGKTVDEILSEMLKKKTFVATVLGSDGKTLGIVTISEIIKELVKE